MQKDIVIWKQEEIKKSTIKQVIKELINKKKVQLNSGNWRNHKMKEACLRIKEWHVEELFITRNEIVTILKELSQIKILPALKKLDLRYCYVATLEGFHRLEIPALQQLQLELNFIDVKEFSKMKLKKLKKLGLNRNSIKQGHPLTNFASPTLQNIHLESPPMMIVSQNQCQTLAWIMKLQSNKLNSICASSPIRLLQKRLSKCAFRKYKKDKIIYHYKME